MRFGIAVPGILVLLLVCGRAPVAAQPPGEKEHEGHEHDATVRHSFGDVTRWEKIFDDPQRDSWQRPDDVLRFLRVDEGQKVADLGAGTGYFTVHLARAVGEGGKVFAVEIESALVEHLRDRTDDLPQVVTLLADPDDPKLPPRSLDLILVVDTWHHIDDRLRYLSTLRGALRPGGRVAVIDFHEGELPVGPPPGHKLSREAVMGEFREAAWTLASESSELPYQYLLVFRPPVESGD